MELDACDDVLSLSQDACVKLQCDALQTRRDGDSDSNSIVDA